MSAATSSYLEYYKGKKTQDPTLSVGKPGKVPVAQSSFSKRSFVHSKPSNATTPDPSKTVVTKLYPPANTVLSQKMPAGPPNGTLK